MLRASKQAKTDKQTNKRAERQTNRKTGKAEREKTPAVSPNRSDSVWQRRVVVGDDMVQCRHLYENRKTVKERDSTRVRETPIQVRKRRQKRRRSEDATEKNP